MDHEQFSALTNQRGHREIKNTVDADHAYAMLAEREADGEGDVVDVATVFLTVAECPLSCTMCDLWKNTLDAPTPSGAVTRQLVQALDQLPPCQWIKLYNSGNFSDAKSIPPSEHASIARLCDPFTRIIIENHPKFISTAIEDFASQLTGQLEVAIGLETIEPGLLESLRKSMTLEDFAAAVHLLSSLGIDSRAFVILAPPGSKADTAVEWAVRSARFAWEVGVRHVSIIPGRWTGKPSARMLESALDALVEGEGVVTADLWDWELLTSCPECSRPRRQRLELINLTQQSQPALRCSCDKA